MGGGGNENESEGKGGKKKNVFFFSRGTLSRFFRGRNETGVMGGGKGGGFVFLSFFLFFFLSFRFGCVCRNWGKWAFFLFLFFGSKKSGLVWFGWLVWLVGLVGWSTPGHLLMTERVQKKRGGLWNQTFEPLRSKVCFRNFFII